MITLQVQITQSLELQTFFFCAVTYVFALMVYPVITSETSVSIYQTTWHIWQDSHIYTRRRQSLKSHQVINFICIIEIRDETRGRVERHVLHISFTLCNLRRERVQIRDAVIALPTVPMRQLLWHECKAGNMQKVHRRTIHPNLWIKPQLWNTSRDWTCVKCSRV
jgi:hypothetical protein